MTTRNINGCTDCPCFHLSEIGEYCLLLRASKPNAAGVMPFKRLSIDESEAGIAPDWCPLRQGLVTLRLNGGE